MNEFPNKSTQFSKDNQPAVRGRPPKTKNLRTLASLLLDIRDGEISALNPKQQELITLGRQMFESWIAKGREGDWRATQAMAEFVEGKVVQETKSTVTQTNLNAELSSIDDASLLKIQEILDNMK